MNLNFKLIGISLISLMIAAALPACDRSATNDNAVSKTGVSLDKPADTPASQSTNAVVSPGDSEISNKVKEAIAADASLKTLDITSQVDKGVVQLSGFVDSEVSRNRANELVTGIAGVGRVDNRLVPMKDK